jgi:tRNA(Ile)-lysidine synthase
VDVEALVAKVAAYCRLALKLAHEDRVLVAVSGGPDSVALLHVLLELGYAAGIGHLDHKTRAGASGDDAAFVRDLGRRLGVDVHEGEAEVAAEAAALGASFEMHARQVRYAFLAQTARAHGYTCIATGHHADDQAETVLMRLIRGTSPRGLGGIPPVRRAHGVLVVRPLLECRRDALHAFLAARAIAYRTDASNVEPHFIRNRVRHRLMPVLTEFNPQAVAALNRVAAIQRAEQAFVEEAGAEAFARVVIDGAIQRTAFAALHEALQRRVLQRFAWNLGVDCEYQRLVSVAAGIASGRTGAVLDLGGGIRLRSGARVVEVETDDAGETPPVPLAVPGVTLAFMRRFTTRYLDRPPPGPLREYCTPGRQVFDADALGGSLCVRRRGAGDSFTPLGMHGTRKVKDFLIDLKLSPSDRAGQLVIVAEHGVVWLVGRAISAHAAVTASTRRVLEVEVTDACA